MDRIREIGYIHRAGTSGVVAYLVLRRAYLVLAGVAGVLVVGVISLVVLVLLSIPSVVEDLRDLSSRVS